MDFSRLQRKNVMAGNIHRFKTLIDNSSDPSGEGDTAGHKCEWEAAVVAALKANLRLAELDRQRSGILSPLIQRITVKLEKVLGRRSTVTDLSNKGSAAVDKNNGAKVEARLFGEIGYILTLRDGGLLIELEQLLQRCDSLPDWLTEFRCQVIAVNGDLAAGRDFVDEDGKARKLTKLSDPEQLIVLTQLLETISAGRVKAQRSMHLGRLLR